MRHHGLFLSLIGFPLPFVSACASHADVSSGENVGTTEAELVDPSRMSDNELATASLRALGKDLAPRQACKACHGLSRTELHKWEKDYRSTTSTLRDTTKSADERLAALRTQPSDSNPYSAKGIGFLAAGAHFGTGPTVNRYPKIFAQGKLLKGLFQGKEDDYAKFRDTVRMPKDRAQGTLTAAEYETIVTWVEKGMPKLEELTPYDDQPTSCTPSFAALKIHAKEMRTTGWQAVNRERHLQMFACDPDAEPQTCFKQQFNGKDIFPDAKSTSYGATWAAAGSTVRILRKWNFVSHYWTRGSADGRFVAAGVASGAPNGYRGVITDLSAALDTRGLAPDGELRTRDIWAKASYDPSFYPDNTGFIFQDTPNGLSLCGQGLLKNKTTKFVTFTERVCSGLGSGNLYQGIGQKVGDNTMGDRFVVYSTWNPGDNAGYDNQTDVIPTGDSNSTLDFHVLLGGASDGSGYTFGPQVSAPTPYEGDTMMSPSGALIASRIHGNMSATNREGQMLGYKIRKVTPNGAAYEVPEMGEICIPGAKATFSYDERFLVTYHYLTRADFQSDAEYAPYIAAPASDIYLVDFATGQTHRITRMQPGQFAAFPYFRSDGWLYFTVRNQDRSAEYVAATDFALQLPAMDN